jgi:hypothetical protein
MATSISAIEEPQRGKSLLAPLGILKIRLAKACNTTRMADDGVKKLTD